MDGSSQNSPSKSNTPAASTTGAASTSGGGNAIDMAKRRWLLENNIGEQQNTDGLFKYDREEQQMIRNVKPWEKDPHYFKVRFGVQNCIGEFYQV